MAEEQPNPGETTETTEEKPPANPETPPARDDSKWVKVQRLDLQSGEFTDHRVTQQGGIAVRTNLTRTGVFQYRQPDGTTRREYRPPDEVFDPESLRTLAHATMTEEHPTKVDPSNWRKVAIGHVAGTPKKAGKFVQGDVHIQHGDAIGKVQRGQLREVSCGYDCMVDPTPGKSPEGEPYDVVQRRIRYNHVASGPAGWGRAGPEVKMHLDGGVGVSGGEPPSEGDRGRYVRATMAEDDQKLKERLDALDRELATLKTTNAELVTKNGALQGQVDVFGRETKERTDSQRTADEKKRADASFEERLAGVLEAQRWLGRDWSFKREDGAVKSTAEIQREIVEKLEPGLHLDGKDAGYVAGACAAAIRRAEQAGEGLHQLADATAPYDGRVDLGSSGTGGRRRDAKRAKGDDEDDDETMDARTKDARDRMQAIQKDSWKTMGGRRKDVRGALASTGAINGGGGNRGSAAGSLGGAGGV